MQRFTCTGFRSVLAESIHDAAFVFASRAAKRAYGRKGYARTCEEGAHAVDYRMAEYQAFIGHSTGISETTGHNVYFTVHRA